MLDIITYTLAVLVMALAAWLWILSSKYKKLYKKAETLFSDKVPGNLAKVIETYLKSVKEVEDHCFDLDKELKTIRKMTENSYQKMGFVRYNPFGDVGGNQSFSVCLLDRHNSGFVISSIHSREGTRVYSKTVRDAESDYNLSSEEKKAIEIAQKGKGEVNV